MCCMTCSAPGRDPNSLLPFGIERIIQEGWGRCRTCQEPYRAIALIAVFRVCVENFELGQVSLKDSTTESDSIAMSHARTMEVYSTVMTGIKAVAQAKGMDASEAESLVGSVSDWNFRDDRQSGVTMKHSTILAMEVSHAFGNAMLKMRSTSGGAVLELTRTINAINSIRSNTVDEGLSPNLQRVFVKAHVHRAILERDAALKASLCSVFEDEMQGMRLSQLLGGASPFNDAMLEMIYAEFGANWKLEICNYCGKVGKRKTSPYWKATRGVSAASQHEPEPPPQFAMNDLCRACRKAAYCGQHCNHETLPTVLGCARAR